MMSRRRRRMPKSSSTAVTEISIDEANRLLARLEHLKETACAKGICRLHIWRLERWIMSNAFCYFAERAVDFSLSELAASIRTVGVQLRNSYTGLLTALNDEGDQVAVTEMELDQSLHSSDSVTFQFWFSEDTDIICSFRRISSDTIVHAYGLDGLDASETER